ncbi:MAG: thiamine pyrophosphate-dependent enzyme [Bacteroidota bacterium]
MTLSKLATSTTPPSSIRQAILDDYFTCCLSREISLYIRRDVLTGRAKFGVSDDGKEVYQIAMAKAYRKGDWRADYYRGHTLLLALDLAKAEDIFAQLYADPDNDPFSAGRQMIGHHMTPNTDANGQWVNQRQQINLSSDISTTAGQMGRGLGLAFASKVYRAADQLDNNLYSKNGQEVCFCNIGDASTSEGAFWESINAAGVLQVPLAVSVADDGYGISVPTTYQTTKGSISEALRGFETNQAGDGIAIYRVKGWDYPALCEAYEQGIAKMRRTHQAAVFHIRELTQPQGHSTSGSHERYKSEERLQWEQEYDCNRQFRLWMLATGVAEEQELKAIEQRAKEETKAARQRAWKAFREPIQQQQQRLTGLLTALPASPAVQSAQQEITKLQNPSRAELLTIARRLVFQLRGQASPELATYVKAEKQYLARCYGQHLLSESPQAALQVRSEAAQITDNSPTVNGYEVINAFFDRALARIPELYIFGEDVGKIGGVNQGMAGLQDKYGEERVFDTGIREWTIVGQAIGMAMRGLRPVAEIQYLDYLIYAMSPLSDDLATLRWRTAGGQQAPVIIRTRGHRLEGIWHSGSPMSVLLGGLRGMHICVPRNMVQAIGMYNTLLQGDDPGLVIECLNGYRLKEQLPENLDTFTVPLGVPEVVQEGEDVTIVTYGSCVRVVAKAAAMLAELGVSVEVVDVQTLWPFDLEHRISGSLRKTNRLLVVDEDVPGGAAAYITQHIIEDQQGFFQLDTPPVTLTGTAFRPPYGDDGNYISKPNVEDVVEKVLEMVSW